MKLFSRFSTRSKVMFGAVLTLAAAFAVAVPAVTHADLEGANRPTKAYVEGMQGFDHVQFNSFTGVPNYGDEREFLKGKISSPNGAFYDAMTGVQSGDEITMRVYVHNNADSSLNASGVGVAKNTKLRVALPTNLAASQTAQAFISADNATPQIIEDDFNVTGTSAMGLQYVPGSASIQTNFQNVALSDDLVNGGTLIGDNNLKGDFPGCFEHVAWISFKVKVTAPSFSLAKKVRMDGTTTWNKQVIAQSGDKVNFELGFHNTGSTQLNKVVVGDRLPVGLTYVPGTTMLENSNTGNTWAPLNDDNWIGNGLIIGDHAPGGASYVKFTATVDDESKLQCGLNRITNFGFAKPEGQGTIEDSAEVDVTKTCAPAATPVFSCDLLDVTKDDSARTVTVSTFKTTATGGATFKSVDLNWGENGVNALNTDTAVGKSHQYAAQSGNGPFTVTATAHFSTPTSDDQTAISTQCAKQVSFTTPATPAAVETPAGPTELVNTGAGNIFGLFAVFTVLGAIVHRLFLGRALARR